MSKPNLPPLPVSPESVYFEGEGNEPGELVPMYSGIQLRAYAEEAVRQALAAQVPVAWRYCTNGVHLNFSEIEPPNDAYDESTFTRLAIIPENSNG